MINKQETLKQMRRELQQLRAAMAEVAESLVIGADDLRNCGTPLNERLLEQCAACSFRFNELVEAIRLLLNQASVGIDLEVAQNLDQLEELLYGFEHKLDLEKRVELASKIVEQASLVRSDAEMGNEFRQQLGRLVDEARHWLAQDEDDAFERRVTELVDGKHVLSALVRLIEGGSELSDEDADQMADLIENEFGRQVERAVIRGRFFIANPSQNEVASVPASRPTKDESEVSSERTISKKIDPAIEKPAEDSVALEQEHEIVLAKTNVDISSENRLTDLGRDESKSLIPDEGSTLCSSDDSSILHPLDRDELRTEGRDDKKEVAESEFGFRRTAIEFEAEGVSSLKQCAPASSLNDKTDGIITELPATYSSFQTYCDFYTRSVDGTVQPAEWKISPISFIERLRESASQRLAEGRIAHVWVMSRAIEECGGLPPVRSIDLTRLSVLAKTRDALTVDFEENDKSTERLRKAIGNSSTEANLPVELFLEAFQTNTNIPLSDPEIEKLIEQAFAPEDLLGGFVEKALKLRTREAFSIDMIRDRIEEAPTVSLVEKEKKLSDECRSLQEEVKRIWSAGGGKIRTTHSRQGWDEFIAIADEVFSDLYQSERATLITSIVDKERQVRKLSEQAKKICDRREIFLHDRSRFDRLVTGLQQMALRVISLVKSRQQLIQRENSHEESMLPLAELKELFKRSQNPGSWKGLICTVLQRVFVSSAESESQGIQWDFTEVDLAQFPELLTVVDSDLIDMPTVIEPQQLGRSTRVASILVQPPRTAEVKGISALVDQLQSSQMNDLLRSIPSLLNESQKTHLKRHQSEQAKEINASLTSLRRAHRELQQVADPLALSVYQAIIEAEELRERLLDDSLDTSMFLCWLKTIVATCDNQIVYHVSQLTRAASELDTETATRVKEKLETRRFSDALFLLGRESEPSSGLQRETNWREYAQRELRDPALALSRATPSLPESVQAFLQEWSGGWQGKSKSADRPLRTKFARLLFGSTEKDKDKPSGVNDSDAFRVPCQNVIDWLSAQKLNPTFLPQLRQFKKLVILTPLERLGSQSLVEQLRAQAANEFGKDSRDLGVFLAPRLPISIREKVIREFNVHGLRASIIDDLDVCRLLNVGGQKINMLLGLLEIILEQQPLDTFLPYQRHDGQHVRQEMFVGRREQAREIAETTQYSRLFSGRKLGKSALLSFVQQTYDGGTLASGNTLRVLYVSGVGASQEADFVERILDELKKQIAFAPTINGTTSISLAEMSPTECLVKAFEQFNNQRPNESVLVLFDEADLFMERQIADYEIQKEKSLSFAIRSRVEAAKDSAGLPRVRFLFSGYRVTHRSDGAWTGAWGDVLRLAPLDPEDATKLVKGPLERLGVQSADVAPTIAWRCGYQPALIIGFCRQLLQQKPSRGRIDDDAVAATFESTIVQDEIRAIVDSNFQGNQVSGIVFLAMIWTFYDYGASNGVVDLPDTLYRRLVDVYDDVSWLRAADSKSAINQIEIIVQDFVRRQLIREERSVTNVRTCFARFPHHIAILMRGLARDPKGTIRRQIEDYNQGSSSLSKDELALGVRSLYPFSVLSGAIDVLRKPDPAFPVRAIIFGDDWTDTVPRAELSPEKGFVQISADDSDIQTAISEKPLLMVANATVDSLDLLSNRGAELPPPVLIGGPSLLREAIRQEIESDHFFYRLSLGRVGRSSLQWWFTRMRAIEFDADGLEQIMQATSGIPVFVQRIDELLGKKGLRGGNVDHSNLRDVILQFRESTDSIRRPLAGQLTEREKQIVEIVLHLSCEVTAGDSLTEWLLNWDQLFPESGVLGLRPADTLSMRVVQELGLVPIHSENTTTIEKFVAVDPEDAVRVLFQTEVRRQ